MQINVPPKIYVVFYKLMLKEMLKRDRHLVGVICLKSALPFACVTNSSVSDINSPTPGGLSFSQTAS